MGSSSRSPKSSFMQILANLPIPTTVEPAIEPTLERKEEKKDEPVSVEAAFNSLNKSLQEWVKLIDDTEASLAFNCKNGEDLPRVCEELITKHKKRNLDDVIKFPMTCTEMLFVLSFNPSVSSYSKVTDPYYQDTLRNAKYVIKNEKDKMHPKVIAFLQAGLKYLQIVNPEPVAPSASASAATHTPSESLSMRPV